VPVFHGELAGHDSGVHVVAVFEYLKVDPFFPVL
jgi:hypothetical protein